LKPLQCKAVYLKFKDLGTKRKKPMEEFKEVKKTILQHKYHVLIGVVIGLSGAIVVSELFNLFAQIAILIAGS